MDRNSNLSNNNKESIDNSQKKALKSGIPKNNSKTNLNNSNTSPRPKITRKNSGTTSPTRSPNMKNSFRKTNNNNNSSLSNPSRNRRGLMVVDIVTGKELVYIYFDFKKIVHAVNNINSNLTKDWCEENQYTPASIIKEDSSNNVLTVRLTNGETVKMSNTDVVRISLQDDSGVKDILSLKDFSEKSLIYTLRVRYNRDEIYTSVGSILISLNPYKYIDNLYSDEEIIRYHNQDSVKMTELPPHLFAVGEAAYTQLMQRSHNTNINSLDNRSINCKAENQSIIISGESGAGKTEATKFIMSYLARIANASYNQFCAKAYDNANNTIGPDKPRYQTPPKSSVRSLFPTTPPRGKANEAIASMKVSFDNTSSISTTKRTIISGEMNESYTLIDTLEQKVLNTNPILEAFGNAQTLRNDNSSRFGKFIKIQFSKSGRIVGAVIQKYLLEKTRVISQSDGERNYHIFYQLLSAFSHMTDNVGSVTSPTDHSALSSMSVHKTWRTSISPAATNMNTSNTKPSDELITTPDDSQFPSRDISPSKSSLSQSSSQKNNVLHTNSKAIKHIYSMIQDMDKNKMFVYNTIPKPEHFYYLSFRHSTLQNINDHTEFLKLLMCLESIQITTNLQIQLFSLLMGILYLGNVKFEENDDNNHVPGILDSSLLDFQLASKFLGLPEHDLVFALTKQNMYVGGNVIVKVASQSQAYDKKDSLCKTIYSMIFSWLVDTINSTITATAPVMTTVSHSQKPIAVNTGSSPVWGYIGILDIYGFENFTTNGFEQLLINYANEKLQNHFNKHIFYMEQNEYTSESIDWSFIQYQDNQTCIDLIENKINGKTGIFQTLDDTSSNQNTSKSSTDLNSIFLTQINGNAVWAFSSNNSNSPSPRNNNDMLMSPLSGSSGTGKHPNYLIPRFNSDQYFGIKHYAGDVYYNIQGFVEKNRDSTNLDAKDLMLNSTNKILSSSMETENNMAAMSTISSSNVSTKSMVSPSTGICLTTTSSKLLNNTSSKLSGNGNIVSKLKEDSISKQFTLSLRSLYETLDSTQPHYIRCIKPNIFKQPDSLHSIQCLDQLRYAGMYEAIRIRKEGYALRLAHQEFFKRFQPLIPSSKTLQDLVSSLSIMLNINMESWQIGTTKIFLKTELSEKLENLLWLRYTSASRTLQRFYHYCHMKNAIIKIQKILRMYKQRKSFLSKRNIIIKIQSLLKMQRIKRLYLHFVQIIIKIQAMYRGRHCRIQYQSLRNPYRRMSYEELTSLYNELENSLEQHMIQQEFTQCEKIQCKLNDIKLARSQYYANTDQLIVPLSRKEIEMHLLELNYAYNYSKMHYSDNITTVLLKQIENLENEKSSYPTVEEITILLNTNKKELEIALTKKEFKKCSELRDRIRQLENGLEIATFTGSYMKLPPLHELKAKRLQLESELSLAMSQNQFELCDNLQSQLDPLLNEIERLDMTIDIALQKIKQFKIDKEIFMSKLDFKEMAVIDMNIKTLEYIIETSSSAVSEPANNEIQNTDNTVAITNKNNDNSSVSGNNDQQNTKTGEIMTRVQLEELILQYEQELQQQLKEKQYKRCDELNDLIEKLKNKRIELPTSSEINSKIIKLESELSVSLKEKNYMRCENIENELITLKYQFEQVKASEPEKIITVASDLTPTIKANSNNLQSKEIFISSAFPSTTTTPQKANKAIVSNNSIDTRPVSKLRPKIPIVLSDQSSVTEVSKAMTLNRVAAALLINPSNGGLSGILTDNDITRRIISQHKNPQEVKAFDVMTKNPKCVQNNDPALDALDTMVENKFRHLPVLDEKDKVVGLLDIAKCLHDAISALEKTQENMDEKNESNHQDKEALSQVMITALKKVSNGRNTGSNHAKQLAAMQAMMEEMFGESIPTLRSILGDPSLFIYVHPSNTVTEAAEIMSKVRKGVLVMESNKLVGILTPKDVMNRVVSKDISASETLVSSVMTPNPDCVSADLTLLDALREMSDHKFLHLPVKDNDGKVLGLVDVMELVCTTAGGEEGGKGWRDFFKGALEARGNNSGDNRSDTGSERSHSIRSKHSINTTNTRNTTSQLPLKTVAIDHRPVSKLRPKAPLLLSKDATVQEIAEILTAHRADAGLLVSADNSLSGIITDSDITRRIISQFIDPSITIVSTVMTANPKCVKMTDSALDALDILVENKFRHLPVLNESGDIAGLLDITKCLHDAIVALEKVHEKDQEDNNPVDEKQAVLAETMLTVIKKVGGNKKSNKGQLELLQSMMQQMFGESIPTLRSILSKDKTSLVSIRGSSNVREATVLMTKARKGVLVLEDNKLVGILTPKDVMNRVVSVRKNPDLTAVSSVMTPNPDCVSADLTLLDALREMSDHKFLHLPVKDNDGKVLGLVDVMELVCTTAGGEEGGKGWRDFFKGALEARGNNSGDNNHSDTTSERSNIVPLIKEKSPYQKTSPRHRSPSDPFSDITSVVHMNNLLTEFSFKIVDTEGHIHRMKSSIESLDVLKTNIWSKLCSTSTLNYHIDTHDIILKYIDDEKDEIIIASDSAVKDAVEFAKHSGMSNLKLDIKFVSKKVNDSINIAGQSTEASNNVLLDNKTEKITFMHDTNNKLHDTNNLIIGGIALAAVTVLAVVGYTLVKNKK